ncbi:MAG TPA: hypothetical protein VLD38_03425 [Nitrosopumilaceae archaeon]|nr:hypothetical protein [Nitrosopumilaceae archaeon]
MKTKFYIIFTILGVSIILINAFFGHLIFDFGPKEDINKYSIYIHLLDEWKSYPGNIIFYVTTVWENPKSSGNDPYYEPDIDVQLKTEYNKNEIQYAGDKSFVQLKHEFSDCKNNWKPVLYRQIVDRLRSQYDHFMGTQTNSDPYVVVYPRIPNNLYNETKQESKLASGYSQFIPICTSKEVTSYDYSVKIDDEKLGFDVYFVPSVADLDHYRNNINFSYYHSDGCFGKNFHMFSGTCAGIGKDSGLLIVMPDELTHSLTKITVNLQEKG